MEALLHTLAGLDGWLVYALLALLVFGESAAIVALLLPGEIALLAAGALAAQGHASLPLVLAIAVVAAIAGHAAGYELGRRYGLSLLHGSVLRRHQRAAAAASVLVTRHGGKAVFLGRWTNVGRIVVPLLVGAGRMRYRTFTVYNVLGGVAWALTFTLLGAAAGASLDVVQRILEQVSWGVSALLVVGVTGAWGWHRRRARRAADGPRHGSAAAVPASSPRRDRW